MGLFNKKKTLDNTSVKYGVNLVANEYPTSSIAEQFRTVMTNISFTNVNKDIHSIMIASSEPSEGKSTVSANLAITYAKQGKNVILIDADLRKPTVHKSFGVSNRTGLSSILSKNSTIEDAIKYTSIPGLSVITSGPIPPNPSVLLGNGIIDQILDKYSQSNDLVIFDVPPVNSITDASIIAAKADATIMVLPQGIADKKEAKQAINQLRKVDANILGGIMNMAKSDDSNDYYYYYYSK